MLFSGEHKLFSVSDREEFDSLAMDVFSFQANNNIVYSEFIRALKLDPSDIRTVTEIPFLPISLFKNKNVVSGEFVAEASFKSSGTSGMDRSVHNIRKLALYESSFMLSFSLFYGDPANITIYALLPSYMERNDSSLVYMADALIRQNKLGQGGFFLDNYPELLDRINKSKERGEKILLLGVSFALLELAEKYSPDLSEVTVMETGGMKGRRKEIVREELHNILCSRMNIDSVHSEYGMTELLSQAWSGGEGLFHTPPWMRINIRDPLDAMSSLADGRTGGINIIDLANIYSCSFIETSDLGIINGDSSFEVSGRFDSSDIRGCNLLI